MNSLRQEIANLEHQLEAKKAVLRRVEETCRHDWSHPQADHIRYEGYTIPGDPPGTMGIDWRGSAHVPAREEQRWKRTCGICGKIEYTTRTNRSVTLVPKFD